MKETDVLVIGGSAGGIFAAITSKKIYKDKSVLLVRKTDTAMIPGGIPYIFGTLLDTLKNRIPDALITDAGVNLMIGEVTRINKGSKMVSLRNGEDIAYEKLVLAVGSNPIIPKHIQGYDLRNVFPVVKDEVYLACFLEELKTVREVVIIGGGFTGVEFAEQLQITGKRVTLVEAVQRCLWQAFDDEVCQMVEDDLKSNGITIMTGTKVNKIIGKGKVEAVKLDIGVTVRADAVILATGVTPNSILAQEAGLLVNGEGAIKVDNYMRTSCKDIFAIGDCAEKRCFFTNQNVPVLLASTAALEAKVAALNLFGLKYIRENKGVISAYSAKIFGKTYAAAGMTERRASEEGFEIVAGRASTVDRHPKTLPGASAIDLKLIFIKTSGSVKTRRLHASNTSLAYPRVYSFFE